MSRFGVWMTRLVDEVWTVETKRARIVEGHDHDYMIETTTRPHFNREPETFSRTRRVRP